VSRRDPELRRLLDPAARLGLGLYRALPWAVAVLAAAYVLSGITVVQADEVALVLRGGRLVGAGAGAAQPPGLLFSLPRPFDEVLRVPVKRVEASEVNTLHFARAEAGPDGDERRTRYLVSSRMSIDPEQVGYALTGDRNVLHAALVVRWQVRDPVAATLRHADLAPLIDAAISAAAVQSLGEQSVDAVLSEGRQALVLQIQRRAQARLDRVGAGVGLLAVELTDLSPPHQVKEEFAEVQGAFITAETRRREAEEYAAVQVPAARSDRGRLVSEAQAAAAAQVATAHAAAEAFRALSAEARREPGVLRERLYREAIEAILKDAGAVRFVPPPIGARYTGLRLELGAPAAAPAPVRPLPEGLDP
jgi:membrane protease subunit HflK